MPVSRSSARAFVWASVLTAACDEAAPSTSDVPASDLGPVDVAVEARDVAVDARDVAVDARDAANPQSVKPSLCARPTPLPEATLGGRFEVTPRMLGGSDAMVVVGDCDGDGLVDAVHGSMVFRAERGGGFARAGSIVGAGRKAGAMVDLDGDGALDLVLAGASVALLRGDGRCAFGPPVELAPPTRGEAGQVLVRDLDDDGLADVTVSRQERDDVAYQVLTARGDGRFDVFEPPPTPRDHPMMHTYRAFAAWYDDVDGDGALDLFASVDHDLGWFAWGVPGSARPTFRRDDALTVDVSAASPMGVSPLDIDRDGVFEYFVAGSFGHNRLYRRAGPRRLEDIAELAGVCLQNSNDDFWGSLAFDANMDGHADLLALSVPDTNDAPGPARLFVGRGDGAFARAPAAALDARLMAYGLACGDFEADGHVSCFARDRDQRGVVLLRNRVSHVGRWVGLRLRGTVSPPDASGARVSLEGEARPLVALVDGQSPTAGEHDRGALLAVGDAATAAVTVAWPSGLRQRVEGLRAGTYTTVTEPRAVAVSPRVAPADGRGLVEVTVDPRAAGAREAAIACEGACAWEADAAVDASGVVRRRLRAPATPGSARVVVTLDGHALRVRPRVRFE